MHHATYKMHRSAQDNTYTLLAFTQDPIEDKAIIVQLKWGYNNSMSCLKQKTIQTKLLILKNENLESLRINKKL